jgi:hypothetical protein
MAIKDELLKDKKPNRRERRRARRNNPFRSTKSPRLLRDEKTVQDYQSGMNMNWQNANQYNPFGNQTVMLDQYGRPTLQQNLSSDQQSILDRGEGLTQQGQQLAQQGLQGYKSFNPQNAEAMRGQFEDQVFGRLTRGLEDKKRLEREQLEQTLYNRGIPLDPNDRLYQSYMTDFNKNYQTIEDDARAKAVEMAGAEMGRNYTQNLQTHQQGLSDINNLQQQGTGLMLPQFQGYQASQYNLSNPSDLYFQKRQTKQNQQQIDNQRAYQMGMLGVAQGNLALNQQMANRSPQGSGGDIYEY